MLIVDIDDSGVPDFSREWRRGYEAVGRDVAKWIRTAVEEGADQAKKASFKDRTGDARRNTKGRLEGSAPGAAYGWIESLVPYASYLDEGTAPHIIRPKDRPGHQGPLSHGPGTPGGGDSGRTRHALRWFDDGGGIHFARKVNHPGTKGFGYMGAAAIKAEAVIIREVEMSFDRLERFMNAA